MNKSIANRIEELERRLGGEPTRRLPVIIYQGPPDSPERFLTPAGELLVERAPEETQEAFLERLDVAAGETRSDQARVYLPDNGR